MGSPRRQRPPAGVPVRVPVRARAALAVGALLGAGALAGCGSPAAHLTGICTDLTDKTAALAPYAPAAPLTALQFALGRFTVAERAVATAREASLPTGTAGTLRRAWLDPATASLADWHARLETLRRAVVADDRAGVAADLPRAVAVGTEGVDRTALDRAGLAACARAFTAPDPSAPAS